MQRKDLEKVGEDAKESSSLFSCNMCRESEVTDLRGGGKAAVVGGGSGMVLSGEWATREDGVPCGTPVEECKRQKVKVSKFKG